MNEIVLAIIGGSCGAAIVTGTVSMIQFFVNRKDKKSGIQCARDKALRYLMLYIIEERAKQHIRDGSITLEQRRRLHHWHKVYHDGLGGNGDADALMAEVDELQTDVE